MRGHDVVKQGSFCSASVLSPHCFVVAQWMHSDRGWGGLWWTQSKVFQCSLRQKHMCSSAVAVLSQQADGLALTLPPMHLLLLAGVHF